MFNRYEIMVLTKHLRKICKEEFEKDVEGVSAWIANAKLKAYNHAQEHLHEVYLSGPSIFTSIRLRKKAAYLTALAEHDRKTAAIYSERKQTGASITYSASADAYSYAAEETWKLYYRTICGRISRICFDLLNT